MENEYIRTETEDYIHFASQGNTANYVGEFQLEEMEETENFQEMEAALASEDPDIDIDPFCEIFKHEISQIPSQDNYETAKPNNETSAEEAEIFHDMDTKPEGNIWVAPLTAEPYSIMDDQNNKVQVEPKTEFNRQYEEAFPLFTEEMANHQVPHERDQTTEEIMESLGMRTLSILEVEPDLNQSAQEDADPFMVVAKELEKELEPEVTCILCSRVKCCIENCPISTRNANQRKIPIPDVHNKVLYTFENPEKVRKEGPEDLNEFLSFTYSPFHLCIGPKKTGPKAPKESAWLYALIEKDEKYVIKWATCVDWQKAQKRLKVFSMKSAPLTFADRFLENWRLETRNRVEEKAKREREIERLKTIDGRLEITARKLHYSDNLIKGCLMAFKNIQYYLHAPVEIVNPDHPQYMTDGQRLANIARVMDRIQWLALNDWVRDQGIPSNFFSRPNS